MTFRPKLSMGFGIFLILAVSLVHASPIDLYNTNGTGIILHPSQTHAYYYVNTSLHSLTPIIIDSHYIVLSGVLIDFEPSANATIYINSFDPEHIAEPNTTIANFTVVPENPDTDINFYIGNLTDVPLVIYKDNRPFFVGRPTTFHCFKGNVTVNTTQTLYFADGRHVAEALEQQAINISKAKTEHGIVTVRGSVLNVTQEDNNVIMTISDNTGTTQVIAPPSVPVERGKHVIVTGESREGRIEAHGMWLEPPSHFSAHTYVIKTLPAVVTAPVGGAPPAPSLSAAVHYASYAIAGLLVLLVIVLITRRIRGGG